MTEQAGRETDEVFSSIGDTVRGAVFAAIEVAILISARRAERAQQARAESDAAARRDAQRLRAEREGAVPIMRQPWNDRWWKQATPERIANTWQVTASWANNGDPLAQTTLQHMREEIAARYGVTLPDDPTEVTSLAEILGAEREATRLESGSDTGAEEFAEPERAYRYEISQSYFELESDKSRTVSQGVLHLSYDDGRPVDLIAAETLLQYQQEHPGDGYSISIEPADSEPGGSQRYHLDGTRAEAVRDAALDRRARILRGDQEASLEELRDALLAERGRLGEEIRDNDPRFAQAREQLAAQRGSSGATGSEDAARAAGQPAADAAERVADAREKMAQLSIRLRAVEAEIRGENGSHVFEAAALRASLDDGWWQTASSAEVTAIYGHVQQWSDGQAKDGMLTELQADISRHYGVNVDKRATPEEVDNTVYQGQAEQRDRDVLDYRIETTLTTGERREVGSGRASAPKDEPAHETARRILNEHAGDLDAARDQRLAVTTTDRQHGAVRSFAARELFDGPERREAERLRELGLDENAGSVRAIEAGNQLDETDEPAAAAQRERAAELREAAEQDLDAAATLEAVPDAEAREAVKVAADGWARTPAQRLASSGQRAGRGASRPPRTPNRQPTVER